MNRLAGLGALALVLAACSGGQAAESTTSTSTTTTTAESPNGDSPPALTVVATTSIAGDLVSQIVGDSAAVNVLMPIGADPHDFQPSSQQAAALRTADLVVAWGLGLEEGLVDVLESAVADGVRVLEISALVDPIEYGGHDDHADDDHADDDHADDDHADDDHADDHAGRRSRGRRSRGRRS
jgi:zinc/manganese transport system substrate-binding protein